MCDDSYLLKLKTTLQAINSNLTTLINGDGLENSALENIRSDIRFLRNSCSHGPQAQNFLIEQPETLEFINLVFSGIEDKITIELAWQFIANLTVQNKISQKFVWDHLRDKLFDIPTKPIDGNADKKLMIVYNMCKGGLDDCSEKLCLALVADTWHKILEEESDVELVFVDLFFEYFLVTLQWTPRLYATVSVQNRIDILKYIATYLRNESPNGKISRNLMEYISKEFKKKADCILRNSGDLSNSLHPQEVYELLSVISCASGSEMYYNTYREDGSLFHSVGALLQSIVALGKKTKNQFTPMTKLEEVAPGASTDTSFESEISFELKTLLVRTIGNLLHMNRANQQHCVDMNLLPVLLECTVMDARNPLIKEWSILAIRNACFDCPEVQLMISELTQTGVASNELLTEFNIDLGALRIQPRE